DELRGAGVRVHFDDRTEVSLGRRATEWELKGVPVRLELGPRDLAADAAVMVLRVSGGRRPLALSGIAEHIVRVLEEEQAALLAGAEARRDERIADVATLDDARAAAEIGWARLPWESVGTDGEAEL